ncbi:hypothetical protein ACFL0T_09000, partial [Candidatus Omnitrophota bacterium]
VSLAKKTGSSLIESIELLSEYSGDQIREDQRGLVIRIVYRSKDRTLTDEEIDAIDASIRKKFTETFEAILR